MNNTPEPQGQDVPYIGSLGALRPKVLTLSELGRKFRRPFCWAVQIESFRRDLDMIQRELDT